MDIGAEDEEEHAIYDGEKNITEESSTCEEEFF